MTKINKKRISESKIYEVIYDYINKVKHQYM